MNVRERIEELRRRAGNVYPRELMRLAEAAGWSPRKGGKHNVQYEKAGCGKFPIPTHPGPMKSKRTVYKILSRIEDCLDKEES